MDAEYRYVAYRKYRYDTDIAYDYGEHGHPVAVIGRIAPHALMVLEHELARCWTFTAPPIDPPLPVYVVDITPAQ